MKKLNAAEFHRVMALIKGSQMKGCRAKWYSVLEGRQEGAIFVDDPGCPRVALVCGHRVGAYYAFGDADSDVLGPFVPELLAEHLAADYCALFATSEAWRKTLDSLFTTRFARIAFAFRPAPGWPPLNWPGWPPLNWKEQIPPGFALEPVDAARAEFIQENMGAPWQWFPKYWGSVDGFLARGFGFCIVSGSEAASSCLSAVIGGGEAEILINTYHPRFHRRGLATLAALAFAEHCLALGMTPGWTTDLRNRGSAALAQKVGFVPLGEIYGYRLDRSPHRCEGRWGPAPC